MVLSVAVVGVGAAAAAPTDSVQDTSPLQQANATNATDDRTAEAPRPASQRAGEPPYPVDVPPNQLKNETITSSEVPDVAASGAYGAQATRKAAGDPKRAGDPVYEPRGPVRQWPSSDYAGRSGPYNNSSVYFKDYRLRVVGPNIEIWVAQDLSFPGDDRSDENASISISENQLLYLADEYSNNIYPKETELWRKPVPQNGTDSPLYGPDGKEGVLPDDYYKSADNKSRTVLLVDNIRDQNYYDSDYPTYVAGLFSPTIGQYTDRNTILVDASDWDERLGTPSDPWREGGSTEKYGIEGTLAHEYQHLLHSYADPDETSWINEGLSDLTEKLVGYGTPESHISTYENYPSNSLIEWNDQVDTVGPITGLADYGAAALFQMYGRQQFGEEFTKSVFSDDANGIESVRNALDESNADRNFYDTYQDFSAALLADGRDTKAKYQIEDVDLDVDTSKSVPYTSRNVTAAYGNAYNPLGTGDTPESLNASGIDFPGTPWVTTEDPTDGSDEQVLWSTKGNNLDNSAIFEANLTNTDSPTLEFDTYYDIESGWDYAFVQVSTDGGETWASLENGNTSSYTASPAVDSTVKKNLPGFTNESNGWVTEEFDLSKYSGQEVLISLRYVTDGAAVQPGFYARDISVSGTDISYSGESTEPFKSLREARENYIRYQFSTVGLDGDTAEVEQYGPETFENNGSTSLSPLPEGEFNETIFTATWAPEEQDRGTVPYGYEVNPQQAGGADGKNTVTIVGQGDRSEYTFSVTDDLSKSTANDANINTDDDIRRGYVANGEVGISADSYTFSGTLETIKVSGDAEVYLNGERVSDDKIDAMRDNVIEIAGTGDVASYDFAATNGNERIQKVTANNANLNANDEVWRTTGNGQVGISKDAYGFNGVIDSLEVDGDANVYVNGREVDPDNEQDNMITIVGTGDAASYEFTTSSTALAPSNANYANTNGNDVISGDTKTGVVGISADSNDYSGDITSFSSSGADIQVYVDGEQVDQDDVASEA